MEPDNAPHSKLKTTGVGGRFLILWTILCCTCSLRLARAQDVDVLQQLGLSERRPGGGSSSSGTRIIPNGVIPFKSGIILTPRARIQVPLRTVIPASYSSANLSLILSLSVHRVNSAFLFSVLSKRRKVQLALQFVPGKVVVHVGQRSSVSFDYDVHDGRWHSLALDVRGHEVFLHTSCGKHSVHADLHSKKEEALDPEGSFLLGKMNHNSVPFEGAICQFDIYPSAKAAHNYCDYIKKHCREADTHRPVFPPLLPLFSTDPNITVSHITPLSQTELSTTGQRPTLALTAENTRTTILVPTDRSLTQNRTSVFETAGTPNPGAVSVSPPPHPGLEIPFKFPTQTVTTSLRINMTPQNPKSHAEKNTKHRVTTADGDSVDVPASTGPSEMKPNLQTTAASTQGSRSTAYLPHKTQLSTVALKSPEPKVTSQQDVNPTSIILVTPAATDGFQTFDQEPTHYSLLAGAPGLKGEPGPPGLQGLPGLPGKPGKRGPRGPPGPHGNPGRPGPPGEKGHKGDYGFSPGPAPKGEKGEYGVMGPPGTPGQGGRKGQKGPHGPSSLPGEPGERGDDGSPGAKGYPGRQGLPGPVGKTGPTGARGRQRGLQRSLMCGYVPLDYIVEASTMQSMGIYTCLKAWLVMTAQQTACGAGHIGVPGLFGLPGPNGERGIPGVHGKKGKMGRPGFPGDFGERGPPGPDGNPGELGAPGPHGVPGLVGDMGPLGIMGSAGPPGLKGVPGNPGDAGLKGDKGDDGLPGEVGQSGFQGDKGFPGSPGLPGPRGKPGPQGKPGEKGPDGLPGPPGPEGFPGDIGPPGQNGPEGPKGRQGLRGLPGPRGTLGLQGEEGPVGPAGPAGFETWEAGIPWIDGRGRTQGRDWDNWRGRKAWREGTAGFYWACWGDGHRRRKGGSRDDRHPWAARGTGADGSQWNTWRSRTMWTTRDPRASGFTGNHRHPRAQRHPGSEGSRRPGGGERLGRSKGP